MRRQAKIGSTAGLGNTSPGGRSRRKGSVKAQLRLDEESRLRAKREALEEQRLLKLRTGSLHDFISAFHPVKRTAGRGARSSPPGKILPGENFQAVRRARQTTVGPGVVSPGDQRASREGQGFPDSNRGVLKKLRGGDNNGGLTVLDKSSNEGPIGGPAGSVEKEGPVSRPSRLQDTLHRYRFFGDPITSQQEAMRSLQMKDSLYPTLRFAQPWDSGDFDPLDEYLSSSSASSADEVEEEDARGSGSDCRSASSPEHDGSGGWKKLAGVVADGWDLTAPDRRAVKEERRQRRRIRRRMIQARKRANEVALATERGRGSDAAQAAARAAAESAAKEEANGKAFRIDVSKLADFRYSKIKETLSLGSSEQEWASEEMYEVSSRAASEDAPGCALPPQLYGSGARPRFFDLYRLVHRQKQTVEDDALEEEEFTPRRRFLRDSLTRGRSPSPTVLRSRIDPHCLDLAFQGLGDEIGLSLAATLPHLPLLTSMSLRDNRLTDASLDYIIAEAIQMKSLTSLDLSSNKIDHSALALREYVASSSCTLQRLSLSNADVDDDECHDLMEALARNLSVKVIDLSHNMIGEKETYNFVRPDYTTGGEAAADMLEANITLLTLDLSWNSVRMASGVALGQSLAHNSALTELKLAHNSLADAGVQAIAQSLRANGSLKLLDISFNNLKPRAAMVLSNALLDNASLDRLVMSHNNVGRSGARAVFMALRQRARPGVELLVDLQSCELGSEPVEDVFDVYNPSGRYDLDLSKPYDYMVARMLLDMANKTPGCEFIDVDHRSGERGGWKPITLARRIPPASPKGDLKRPSLRNSNPSSKSSNARKAPRPPAFGERDLGNGPASSTGDWRVPAEALFRYCSGDGEEEGGGEAKPEEVEAFLKELGLDPSRTILERVCEDFNTARRAERSRQHSDRTDTVHDPAEKSATGVDNDGGAVVSPNPAHREAEAETYAMTSTGTRVSTMAPPTSATGRESPTLPASPTNPKEANLTQRLSANNAANSSGADTGGEDNGLSPEKHAMCGLDKEDTDGAAFGGKRAPGDQDTGKANNGVIFPGKRSAEEPTSPFGVATHVFELLFSFADKDNSGRIDDEEFRELLLGLGREIGCDVARHCIASYDIDRSNTIEADEFVDFMTHEFIAPVVPSPGLLHEGSADHPWDIPKDGHLRLTVVVDYVAPAPLEVASQDAVDALIENIRFSAKTEQDKLEMFQLATEGTDFYMTSLNAQAVIDEWNNGINLVDILEIMVPQMVSERNVVSLVENNLSYAQRLELRSKLGQAWGPLVGNPTGTYCLDMSDRKHLVAARRLAMINHAEKFDGISGAAGRQDTSQRGHWNNFRNETFNGLAFPGRGVDGRWFANAPPKGKLRLDYVSTTRPLPGTRPLSSRRFQQLLDHLDLGDMPRSTKNRFLFGDECFQAEERASDIAAAAGAASAATPATSAEKSNTLAPVKAKARADPKALSSMAVHASATPIGGGGHSGATGGNHPKLNGTEIIPSTTVLAPVHDTPRHFFPPPRAVLDPLPMGAAPSFPASPCGSDDLECEERGTAAVIGSGLRAGESGCPEGGRRLEMMAVHRTIKEGKLRPITPDQVYAFHAEYQVTSKTERRRGWAIMELGHPLIPDEDIQLASRDLAQSAGGSGGGNGGGEKMSDMSDMKRESMADRSEDERGLKEGTARAAAAAAGGASVGSVKSEVAAMADPKPNFGDKQKPLFAVPLMWRKLVGKPQYKQDYKLALSKLCELRVQVLRHWLTVEQVIITMNFFPRCDFLRVIVAAALFGRLVDVENVDLLLDEFTHAEEEEFLWRIGPLNCYNPMKPDRDYDLDLTHRDEREVCKVLARLAVDEPGENWVDETYCWSFAQRPVPGWELPISWTTPDSEHNGGPRHFGRLTLTYSSDPTKGCAPKWDVRETLMAHFLAGHKQKTLL